MPRSREGRAAAGVRTPSCRVEAGCLTDSASAACLRGLSRGESFRALQGEGMNGFAFKVCCAVDLSRAGNGLPRMAVKAVSPGAGNEETAWTGVSGGWVVSLARVIHLAVRGPWHCRRAAETPQALLATPVMPHASLSFLSEVRSGCSGLSPLKGKGGLRCQWFYPSFSSAVFSLGRCGIHRPRACRPSSDPPDPKSARTGADQPVPSRGGPAAFLRGPGTAGATSPVPVPVHSDARDLESPRGRRGVTGPPPPVGYRPSAGWRAEGPSSRPPFGCEAARAHA